MKNYNALDKLVPKTQELHRAIFDTGYEQGFEDGANYIYDHGKEYCVETLMFEYKRLKKEVIASSELHKLLLNNIKQEIEQIGATEQETNGKTDYLKGINTCLDIIDKYSEGGNI